MDDTDPPFDDGRFDDERYDDEDEAPPKNLVKFPASNKERKALKKAKAAERSGKRDLSEATGDAPLLDHDAGPTLNQAMSVWRGIAHRRGLVVLSPTKLRGSEQTVYGESENMVQGEAKYELISKRGGIPGLSLSKDEKNNLEDVADTLLDNADLDITTNFTTSDKEPDRQDDERGRWPIVGLKNRRVGFVVRVGEGASKHYLLFLWRNGEWVRASGALPYDLPVFGLPEIVDRPSAPVMIHEGPKAREGAIARMEDHPWLAEYVHIAWHGSKRGVSSTDWTPLRDRKVKVWADMDEPGVYLAYDLARHIAKLTGELVEHIRWSVSDMQNNPSWDWADAPHLRDLRRLSRATSLRREYIQAKRNNVPASLTLHDIATRTGVVESIIDPQGFLHEKWILRTRYNKDEGTVYEASTNYRPIKLERYSLVIRPTDRRKIAEGLIPAFRGVDYLPGVPYGPMDNGKLNLCRPYARAGNIPPGYMALSQWRDLHRKWLSVMMPDREQRKHFLHRAAMVIAAPENVPQHMVLLVGDSGTGKSTALNVIYNAVGPDHAVKPLMKDLMGSFNADLVRKSLAICEEVHGIGNSKTVDADIFKTILGNRTIRIEAKFQNSYSVSNVLHWFGAANNSNPFTLRDGNDRFYYVECSPLVDRAWFRANIDHLTSSKFADSIYAAAIAAWPSIVRAGHLPGLVGRAQRQKFWDAQERMSLRPWEQTVLSLIQDACDQQLPHPDAPFVFSTERLARHVAKEFKVGPYTLYQTLRQLGYHGLRLSSGHQYRRRSPYDIQKMWGRKSMPHGQFADATRLSFFGEKHRDES